MKKVCIFILSCLLTLSFSSCNTQIDNETATTDMTAQTSAPVSATIEYPYVIARTSVTEEEAALQEKIDAYQKIWRVPSKVIFSCGEKRDIPFLRLGVGCYYDESVQNVIYPDGVGAFGYSMDTMYDDSADFPIYTISADDAFSLHVNDEVIEDHVVFIVDTKSTTALDSIGSYRDAAALYDSLDAGRYYAYIHVTCYGDEIVMHEDYRVTEEISYLAYFILDVNKPHDR